MARDDLEQQRLDLEPPHEVGERLRRLLGLGDHRVRQRDLPIRLDEQHADVELHLGQSRAISGNLAQSRVISP